MIITNATDRTFSQYPKTQIDAYSIIEKIIKSEADSLFLLDCFLQTRLREKWTCATGVTEIIMRPECMQTSDGRVVLDHEGDFTDLVVDNLFKYITKVKHNNRKEMITIPQIMKFEKRMYSKPQRTWLDRTKRGDDTPVYRIKLDPNSMRQTGKLEFVRVQIQGAQRSGAAETLINAAIDGEKEASPTPREAREGTLFHDETFVDDDGLSPPPPPYTITGDNGRGGSGNGANSVEDEEDEDDGLFMVN